MGSPWLSRLAVAAAAAGALTLSTATAAWADTTNVPLHQTMDGKTTIKAADFNGGDDCDGFEDLSKKFDGWHFILPGNGDEVESAGDFKSVTLTFAEGTFTVNAEGVAAAAAEPDEDHIVYFFDETGSGQLKHLYVGTLAGWTLTGGTAMITGTADFFNLSHTCAATTPPGNGTTPPGNGTTPPSTSSAPGAGGGLPVTGVPAAGILVGGIALLAGGVALMAVRRRRAVSELTES